MTLKNLIFDQKCMEISNSRLVCPEVYGNFETSMFYEYVNVNVNVNVNANVNANVNVNVNVNNYE